MRRSTAHEGLRRRLARGRLLVAGSWAGSCLMRHAHVRGEDRWDRTLLEAGADRVGVAGRAELWSSRGDETPGAAERAQSYPARRGLSLQLFF